MIVFLSDFMDIFFLFLQYAINECFYCSQELSRAKSLDEKLGGWEGVRKIMTEGETQSELSHMT